MDSSVKQKISEDNSTEYELSKTKHVTNEKTDLTKSKTEIKSDTDDIENLLTAHVMCKSSTEEATNDNKIDELTKNNKETKKIKSKCTTDMKRNTKDLLPGNNQIHIDRKKQIATNKSDRKSFTSKFRKFLSKTKEINDKNFGTSKGTKDPYLKIRVKSQQDLGLEEHRSKGKFESSVSKTTNKTSDKHDEKSNCDEVKSVNSQCRLCGTIINDKINSSNLNSDLNGKILFHLNIQIKENDQLPQSVCNTCIDKIVNWSQFYEKCSTFQKELNNSSKDQNNKKVESADNVCTQTKSQDISEIETSENPISMNIKKEIADNIEVEDTIEKMLREMHAETNEDEQPTTVTEKSEKHSESHVVDTPEISTSVNQIAPNLDDKDVQNETDDDMEMDVEFLDEERDLVDQALICQHQKLRQAPVIKEEQSSRRKIIRMDRKLSEIELRSLLERTGFSHLPFVTILKFGGKPSLTSADIDKFYKNFKEKLTLAKSSDKDNKSNVDKEYYDMLIKSYAHHILESVQTDSEIFFRCPECRVYLPSGELPRHIQTDHGKITALCDFCKLILPYDSDTNKDLIREHIQLHNADKMANHPEVILNTCKLLENIIESPELLISSIKQEEAPDYTCLSTNVNKKPVPKNRYRCNQCSARFQSAHLVREHVRTHRPEDVTCEHCNEKFTSRYNLESHEKLEHLAKDSQHTCEFCNLEFPDEQSYEQHINLEQNLNTNTFKCPHCSEQFPDRYGLASHIKAHSEQTTFCDYCGLAFASRTDMKSHQKHVHFRDLYTCSQCGCKNFSKISLRNHMRTHHPDVGTPGSPFACTHCDQSFQTANRLREHVIKVHNIIKNFQCPLCDWNFNHEINLKKHFEFHIEKNHTNCKVCNQPFEIAGEKLEISDVVTHKEQHTVEENFVYQRPYSPSVSRMTPWRDAIPPQSGARMFCRDCGVACSIPMELRKHQKTHKPFYCNMCQTVSNNEQTFLLHMEQHADRKHGCKICGKRFMTRTALNLHSRIHASSPKFMCAVCSRKFRIVTDWKRHERSCREAHGWPRMEFDSSNRNSSGRRFKRTRTQDRYVNLVQNNEDESFAELVEDGNNITYEFVEDDSTSDPYTQSFGTAENADQNTYVEYIVQEENSDDVIEIDETQLAEFQEWQRSAQLSSNLTAIKREIVSYAENNNETSNEMMEISDQENTTNSVYYSVEDFSGNKKEYRFLPHYVIQGTDENVDNSQTGMDMSNESDGTIGVIPSKYILPDDQVILNDSTNSLILNTSNQDGSNVVYVDSSNIIYNIQNSINLPQNIGTISGQNIIFQQEDSNSEQMGEDDQLLQSNNHISYVFNDTGATGGEGGVTIYVKENEAVDETLNDINKQTNELESSENNVHISENS